MKKLIYILILALFLAPFYQVSAQSVDPADPLACEYVDNQAEFDRCCTGPDPSDSCRMFQIIADQEVYCRENPEICASIPGGTQDTSVINEQSANPQGLAPSSVELAACSQIKFKSLLDILIWIKCIILSAILPLIFALAFMFFLWGVFRFMTETEQTKREEGKKFIMWGIVGLFVMVSVWGIIKIVGTTLGIESTVPLLQTQSLDPNKASR